jgi:putative hemolysin
MQIIFLKKVLTREQLGDDELKQSSSLTIGAKSKKMENSDDAIQKEELMVSAKLKVWCLGFGIISLTASAIPNPASLYCEENGGKLEIRTTDRGEQYGVCTFGELVNCSDDVCFRYGECEEWDFFNHICKKWDCYQIKVEYKENGEMIKRCLDPWGK